MYKRSSYISVDFFLLKNNIILKVCIDCVGSVVVVVSGKKKFTFVDVDVVMRRKGDTLCFVLFCLYFVLRHER